MIANQLMDDNILWADFIFLSVVPTDNEYDHEKNENHSHKFI